MVYASNVIITNLKGIYTPESAKAATLIASMSFRLFQYIICFEQASPTLQVVVSMGDHGAYQTLTAVVLSPFTSR
jgi:hypothetical protein